MNWEFEYSAPGDGEWTPVAATIFSSGFHDACVELRGGGEPLPLGLYRGRPKGQDAWKTAELKNDSFHSKEWDDLEEWGE